MAASDWRLEGEWIKNCNCAFGCPCDFNAPPTHGSCKGMVGMKITKGHFEGTKLDGLVFAATVDFPGALHEGNGKMQPIIDERATPKQRQALSNIMSGKHFGRRHAVPYLELDRNQGPRSGVCALRVLVQQERTRRTSGRQGCTGDGS